jgi:hypothetical protein
LISSLAGTRNLTPPRRSRPSLALDPSIRPPHDTTSLPPARLTIPPHLTSRAPSSLLYHLSPPYLLTPNQKPPRYPSKCHPTPKNPAPASSAPPPAPKLPSPSACAEQWKRDSGAVLKKFVSPPSPQNNSLHKLTPHQLGIPTANLPVTSATWISDADSGVYFGWAALQLPSSHPSHPANDTGADKEAAAVVPEGKREEGWRVLPMVMSIGYNPFYGNTVRSAVSPPASFTFSLL